MKWKIIILFTIIFIPLVSAGFTIDFVPPTPADEDIITNPPIIINISFDNFIANQVNWSWNGTNVSFYDDTLGAMIDFDTPQSEFGWDNFTGVSGLFHLDNTFGYAGKNNHLSFLFSPILNTTDCVYNECYDFKPVAIFKGGNGNEWEIISGDFTVTAWVKSRSVGETLNYIAKGGGFISPGWGMKQFDDHTIGIFITNDTTSLLVNSSTQIVNETWYFTAFTWDFSESNLTFYLDDEIYSKISDEPIPNIKSSNAGGDGTQFTIGGVDYHGDIDWVSYIGSIDDVYVNRGSALSKERILEIYQSDTPMLVANTSSLYLNNYALLGGTEKVPGKYYGSAVEFDGTANQFLDFGNLPGRPEIQGSGDGLTMEAWVKIKGGNSHAWNIMNTFYSLSGNTGFHTWIFTEDGDWSDTTGQFRIGYGSGVANIAHYMPDFQLDEWHHLVYMTNDTDVMVYFDGELNAIAPWGALSFVPSEGNLFVGIATVGQEIGAWNGSIDEIRIWNRSFTDDEIRQHYLTNLKKFNETHWEIISEQTVEGNHTYAGCGVDSSSILNCTERIVVINNESTIITLISPFNLTKTAAKIINFTASFLDNVQLINATLYIYNETDLVFNYKFEFAPGVVEATVGIVHTLTVGIYEWFYDVWSAGDVLTETNLTNFTLEIAEIEVNFTNPTPPDLEVDITNNATINVTILLPKDSPLTNFNLSWGNITQPIVNFSFYSSDLLRMYGFVTEGVANATGYADDSISNQSLNFTHANFCPIFIAGKYNGAYNYTNQIHAGFPTSGDFLATPQITFADDVPWTIEYWYHQDTDNRVSIGDKDSDNNYLYHINSGATLRLRTDSNLDLTINAGFNTWNHIILTADGSDSNNIWIYHNGTLTDNGTLANSALLIDSIGRGFSANDTTTSWAGILDEVRIFNRYVDSEEAKEHYLANLRKYDSTNWSFISNRTELDSEGQYQYQACATAGGEIVCTEIRTLNPLTDSCTYSAGDWIIDCSDACRIIETIDIGGNNLLINGTGSFETIVKITGIAKKIISGGCKVIRHSGGGFVLNG